MTAVRAYKRPMTLQVGRAELARRSGTQFDPHVVRAFLNISLGRLHWTLGIAAWIAELPFLTIVPRVVAQLAPAGPGGLPQITWPGLAAASLGAMAVVPQVNSAPPASGRSSVTSSRSPSAVAPAATAPVELGDARKAVTNGARATIRVTEPAPSAVGSVVSTATSTVSPESPPQPTLPDVVTGVSTKVTGVSTKVTGVSTKVTGVVGRTTAGMSRGLDAPGSGGAAPALSSESSTVEEAVTGTLGVVNEVTESVDVP